VGADDEECYLPQEVLDKLYEFRFKDVEKLQRLFKQFLGTLKYHNYTRNMRALDKTAQRFMMELDCSELVYINKETFKVTDSADPKALEFVHFYLKGQSFLYN